MPSTVAPEPPLAALEVDAALRAVLDRLDVEADPDARAHLQNWRRRLEHDLAAALLAA